MGCGYNCSRLYSKSAVSVTAGQLVKVPLDAMLRQASDGHSLQVGAQVLWSDPQRSTEPDSACCVGDLVGLALPDLEQPHDVLDRQKGWER